MAAASVCPSWPFKLAQGEAMRQLSGLRAAPISAAIILNFLTAAHADDPSANQNQLAQLPNQNQELKKRISELEKRLRKLETKSAKQQISTPQLARPTDLTPPIPKKAPSLVADDGSLTWHGITL